MPNNRVVPTDATPSVVTTLIKVDGSEIPLTYQVLSIQVVQDVNRIAFAKVTLKDGEPSNEDFPVSNDELFAPGGEVEILLGYESQDNLIFKGILISQRLKIRQDGSSMLQLECRDKAFQSTLAPQTRYFTEMTDAAAIDEIMSAYGLETDVSSTPVTHPELVQFEATDWQFVTSRARAMGMLCYTNDGSFLLKPPDFEQEPVLSLTYGATILEFDGEIDTRLQYQKVIASSWDYAGQKLFEVEAVEPSLPGAGDLSATDLAEASGNITLNLRHNGHVTEDELQAWADAELLKIRMSKIRGRVKFTGYPSVKPGQLIELNGLGNRFNGKVFVSGVRHEVQGGTWQTDVQFGMPEAWYYRGDRDGPRFAGGLVSGVPGLQTGVVTQLQDDPNGENRILVKIPTISMGDEGIWTRVASLDAGENRGAFFLPEIGDEVIVGFIQGDPRDAVVVGMVHSSAKPAPLEASDDNHIKAFVSRSELKIRFDDEKKVLVLETPAGKKASLDDDQGLVLLEDEHGNKLEMSSSGITMDSAGDIILKAQKNLKMEGSMNSEIKAGASFKAEGSAGAEVTTNAVAVLKGSLVKIN